jgi:hypothetical protein
MMTLLSFIESRDAALQEKMMKMSEQLEEVRNMVLKLPSTSFINGVKTEVKQSLEGISSELKKTRKHLEERLDKAPARVGISDEAQLDRVREHLPFSDYEDFENYFAISSNRDDAVEYFNTVLIKEEEYFMPDLLKHCIDKALLTKLILKVEGDRNYHHDPEKMPYPVGFIQFMVSLTKLQTIPNYPISACWTKELRKLTRNACNSKNTADNRERERQRKKAVALNQQESSDLFLATQV